MVERLSCLQAVRSIQTDPYPHTCVEQALPDALYEELEATFPEQWMLERIQRLDAGSPTRRLKVAEALQWNDLAPIWVDFLRFHTSPDYLRDVVRLFEPQLLEALGSDQLHQLMTGSVTPRRIGPRGDLVTDCHSCSMSQWVGMPRRSPPMWTIRRRSMPGCFTCGSLKIELREVTSRFIG